MSNNIKIKRALISVSDKNGIVSLAKILRKNGCEIISTGGTKKVVTKRQEYLLPTLQKLTGNT